MRSFDPRSTQPSGQISLRSSFMFLQLFLRPRSPLFTDLGFLQLIQSGFLRPVHKDFYRHKIQTSYLQIEEGRSLKRENNWAIYLQNLGCLWLVAGIKRMYWDWYILKKHAHLLQGFPQLEKYLRYCWTWSRKYWCVIRKHPEWELWKISTSQHPPFHHRWQTTWDLRQLHLRPVKFCSTDSCNRSHVGVGARVGVDM